jgi:hypothetical protein
MAKLAHASTADRNAILLVGIFEPPSPFLVGRIFAGIAFVAYPEDAVDAGELFFSFALQQLRSTLVTSAQRPNRLAAVKI